MERQPQSTVVVGRPGSGKTTEILRIIDTLARRKGVLVFDVNNEAKYQHFDRLEVDDLKGWNSRGIHRMFTDDEKFLFEQLYRYAYNCAIVFEDATSYIDSNVGGWIKKFLANRRHHGVDLVFTFHSLNIVPVKVYEMSNYLVLHKTNDAERKLQKLDKLPDPEGTLRAWRRVQAHTDPYYSLTIKTNA